MARFFQWPEVRYLSLLSSGSTGTGLKRRLLLTRWRYFVYLSPQLLFPGTSSAAAKWQGLVDLGSRCFQDVLDLQGNGNCKEEVRNCYRQASFES